MKAKYRHVKAEIMDAIMQGRIVENQRINTEHQMAQEYGVSRQTVRQAVGELVSEGWLERRQGSGTYCIRRPGMARPLVNRTIAIVTTDIDNSVFPAIIRGAEEYLSDRSYSITLSSTRNLYDHEERSLKALLSNPPAGIIVEPIRSALPNPNINYYLTLEREGIPYVMINALYHELMPLSLTMDDVAGGFAATSHLLGQGHRRIAGIFKSDDQQGVNRMKGFAMAHRHRGLPMQPGLIVRYDTDNEESHPLECLHQMMDTPGMRPTALVCYRDSLTLRLCDELFRMGFSVPEDISVVGYDDADISVSTEVKLTTVKHPQEQMGRDAARLLVHMLEGKIPHGQAHSIVYPAELLVRNSTRSLGSDG